MGRQIRTSNFPVSIPYPIISITGALLQGDSLPIALDRATQFILQGIRATFGYEYDNREGILLEKVLHNLDMPIQSASYELI